MNWTGEKPKKDGWYWVKDPSGEISVCRVGIFKDGPLITHHDFTRVYDALVGEWLFAGPIPEPSESKPSAKTVAIYKSALSKLAAEKAAKKRT